jgi:hypothetical protein
MNRSASFSVVTSLWLGGPRNRLWIFSKSKIRFSSREFPDLLLGFDVAFRVSGGSFSSTVTIDACENVLGLNFILEEK